MKQTTSNRIMNVLIIVPIVMLLLSTLLLSIAGETVGYYLACGAAALIPLGFDTRRVAKFICLGVVAISITAADADHEAVKFWKRFYETKIAAAERVATTQTAATTNP